MAILYSDIERLLKSALDSEDSERYTPNEDFIPAINYAIDYVTLAFNSIFSQKKLSEEVLKELTYVKVWMPSIYNRIAFDPTIVGMDLWTIVAVYPEAKTQAQKYIVPTQGQESYYLPAESFIDSDYVAKRITLEEWTERNRNVFSAGSPLVNCPELIQYAWVNFANYTGGYILQNNKFEIGISPTVINKRVAIAFLKAPTKITTITPTTSIEFPAVLTTLIYNTALQYISVKQNNKTSVAQLSTMAVSEIIKLLS